MNLALPFCPLLAHTTGQSALRVGMASVLGLLALAMATSPRFRGMAFTGWILTFAASAFCFPELYTWSWHGWQPADLIFPLVQVTMLGMGVTLTFADFGRVLQMPKAVLIGTLFQYTIMPLCGYGCAWLFGLEREVAAGLILVGACPGGVASNVVSYLARANVPLSVTLTICSTLVAPLATPLATKFLAGHYVPIDAWTMMGSILAMIVLPVLVGVVVRRIAPRVVDRLAHTLPVVAMLSVCVIIAVTVALARDDLVAVGLAILGASACHNAVGCLLGYGGARALGLNRRDSRTVALEVGLQNCGMATGLALNVFRSAAAALPSAVFGPWSAVTSSLLASFWRSQDDE